MADGKGDVVGVMEAPHPDTGKLRARSLQAVNLGNTVRHGPRASDRAAGECLISVRRLEPFPAVVARKEKGVMTAVMVEI